MDTLSAYDVVSIVSILIIISYIFSLIGNKLRIPSVLLLLVFGIIVRQITLFTGNYTPIPQGAIEVLGVIGLVLILLEAGLDLKIEAGRGGLIKSAVLSSLFVMILSMLSISSVIHFFLGQPWSVGFIYSVPLGIISSTVVASSISSLSQKKREFLTYESSLSDIFGILVFNYIVIQTSLSVSSLLSTSVSVILSVGVSILVSGLLTWLMIRVSSSVKVFLIFALLILVYATAHQLEIPALPLILIFGLFINNWSKIRDRDLRKWLPVDKVSELAESIKGLTAESAFLARTLFFALFGYSINIQELFNLQVALVGLLITIIIYVVRFLYLRLFSRDHILPELFYAPRGLVTIVLFYQIPVSLQFDGLDEGVLLFVILATSLILMAGSIFFTPHEATKEADEENKIIKETLVQVSIAQDPTKK